MVFKLVPFIVSYFSESRGASGIHITALESGKCIDCSIGGDLVPDASIKLQYTGPIGKKENAMMIILVDVITQVIEFVATGLIMGKKIMPGLRPEKQICKANEDKR